MRDKCFDPGSIQAFTDGELDTDRSERLLRHVAVCGDCAELLRQTEEESAFAFSLLDDELNVLVPTERLRAKVFGSIGEIKGGSRNGWLSALASGFSGLLGFQNPGFAAAASVLLIAGIIAVVISVNRAPADPVAGGGPEDRDVPVVASRTAENASAGTQPQLIEAGSDGPEVAGPGHEPVPADRFRAQTAIYRESAARPTRSAPGTETANTGSVETNIASEDSYLQTIATLDSTVGAGKELLRPSERIAFERDLAVVNDAIVKMKDEVRRNPDNQAAREVLNASYRNKVDLLNSVAEKTELMASLQ